MLPTSGTAKYTGDLSVHRFIKNVTYQRVTAQDTLPITEATAIISRLEGHAKIEYIRLKKHFPNDTFDL